MKQVENQTHGIPCDACGKKLLYGSRVYTDGDKIYCFKCGKEKLEKKQ